MHHVVYFKNLVSTPPHCDTHSAAFAEERFPGHGLVQNKAYNFEAVDVLYLLTHLLLLIHITLQSLNTPTHIHPTPTHTKPNRMHCGKNLYLL